MTVFIHSCAGGVISKSKNLRGVIDRTRRLRPHGTRIKVVPLHSGRACVSFLWADGSWAAPQFEDYTVAVSWVKARRFAGAAIDIQERPVRATPL